MNKIELPISPAVCRLLVPRIVVLVTCSDGKGKVNIMTAALAAPVSLDPPIIMVGVHPARYSHRFIEETNEFVVNLPTPDLVEQVHLCGSTSGSLSDKFKEAKLTPVASTLVASPLIAECPVNFECKVIDKMKPGSHTIFIGQVVAVHVEEGIFDGTHLDLEKSPTLLYNSVEYRRPGAIVKKR